MKSKDLLNVVLSKYQNGDTPTKMCHDFSGAIGLRIIKLWCPMIRQTGIISLSSPPGYPRLVRAKANIKKVKDRLRWKSSVSAGKITTKLDILRISVRQILKNDIGLRPYKQIMEPSLSDDQTIKRKKFGNRVRTNFQKRTQ